MSEDDLQSAILDMCKLFGLLVHHCRPAMMRSGKWATPIQGDKGFPDLVICGRGGTLFVEVKSQKGRLSLAQDVWIERLVDAGSDVEVLRPADLLDGSVQRLLCRLAGRR